MYKENLDESSPVSVNLLLTSHSQHVVTTISFLTAVLGIICNIFVLIFFICVIQTKRIQSSLWTNICFSYLVKCLIMIYNAAGDVLPLLSGTEDSCRFRYALPLSIDITCISCYSVLVMERTAALHCPAFHSLMPKLRSHLCLFGWSYGASYLLFIVLKLQTYDSPIKCHTPYTHMTPVDPASLSSFLVACAMVTFSLTSMLFLYPKNYSKVEIIRLKIEMTSCYLVIAFGTIVLLLWIPKQIITVLFWLDEMNYTKYTVFMKESSMVLDISVLLPFLSVLRTAPFRSTVYCLLTANSLVPIKRKLFAQENYKSTVRKLVVEERKSTVNRDWKFSSISNQSNSTAFLISPAGHDLSFSEARQKRNAILELDDEDLFYAEEL